MVNYPNAYCYLWYHPKVGLWLGATPELLVTQNQLQISTSALAGTAAVTDTTPPNWKNKELKEQQFVTDYIKKILSNQVENLLVSDTETIKAGALWHLKTSFSGRLLAKSSLKDIILQLHPTPAVCGTPRENAKNFILAHEGYSRSYYTGYLGELQLAGANQVSLYVNLRCIQMDGNRIMIYVGGGITADSNPEQEWIETQNKSKTMANLL
jgi:isochorismate synthase